nr:MAG TPA: hypothetical protein [Caudoviricetes sp.]
MRANRLSAAPFSIYSIRRKSIVVKRPGLR